MNSTLPIPARARVRDEVRAYARLAWPMVLAQLSFIGMGAIDTVLAGRLGAQALAAVAVGSNLFFLMFLFFTGLFMAVSPVVAQALGGGDRGAALRPFATGALTLAAAAGLIWALLLLGLRAPVLDWLALDAQTRVYTDGYLFAVAAAPLPFCLGFVLRNIADAHGQTRLAFYAGLTALPVNAVIAYGLMYGRLGMPAIGPAGAGHATAAAALAMIVVYAVGFLRIAALRELRLIAFEIGDWRAAAAEILRLGLPIAAMLTAEGSLFQLGTLLVARFGAETLAAHQIAINFASICFMVPLSIGMAATVRVGLAIGAGEVAAARLRGRLAMLLSLVFALFSAAFMALAPHWIAGVYTGDAAVAALAARFLGFAALFQVFDGVQASANGALRGLKDTRLPMVVTITAYWLVGFPLAVGLAFFSSLGAAGIWCGFVAGLAVGAVGLASRFQWAVHSRVSQR